MGYVIHVRAACWGNLRWHSDLGYHRSIEVVLILAIYPHSQAPLSCTVVVEPAAAFELLNCNTRSSIHIHMLIDPCSNCALLKRRQSTTTLYHNTA